MGWDGPPSEVVNLATGGRFMLITSRPLLDELACVIQYPRLADYFPDPLSIVLLVEALAVMVEPITMLEVIDDDPDDNRVLEAAQAGHADYIVSGDKHLRDLGSFDGTQIVRPAAFLEIVTSAR
jgi:putative PIN family toxin of toxin-antitoxin system